MNNNNEVINVVKELAGVIAKFNDRITKNERLLFETFSYLYTRDDELTNSITHITSNINELTTNFSYITATYSSLSEKISFLDKKLSNVLKPKIHKKRPWYYFLIKNYRYNKICLERARFKKELDLRTEQNKIKAEQLRKEQEEKTKLENEQLTKKRKEEARKKMEEILKSINQ